MREEAVKAIWVDLGPNEIERNLFNALVQRHPNVQLIHLSVPEWSSKFGEVSFTVKALPYYRKIFSTIFIPYKFANWIRGIKNLDMQDFYMYRGLSGYLKKENPDVVLCNNFYMPTSIQAAWYCAKHKIPFILHTETKKFPSGNVAKFGTKKVIAQLRWMFEKARFILPWTQDGVQFAKQHFPLKDKEKIHLLCAGINTRKFFAKGSKIQGKELKILMVARFFPYKRHIDMLKALAIVKKIIPVKLTLLSSGPLEKEIRAEVVALGLQNEVVFSHKVPYDQMRSFYAKHDLLVLPSFNEAIGMVVPEAMACGTPCIVSDTCGAKTYVRDGIDGYYFKTFDPEDLAKKIMLLSKKKKRSLFGKRASQSIRKNFDVNSVADRLYAFIIDASDQKKS